MGKDASSTQWVACMSSSLSAMQLQQGRDSKKVKVDCLESTRLQPLTLRTHNVTGTQQCRSPPHAGGMQGRGGGVRSRHSRWAREQVVVAAPKGVRLDEAARQESLRLTPEGLTQDPAEPRIPVAHSHGLHANKGWSE